MISRIRTYSVSAFVLAGLLAPSAARAMPNFARKYKLECSMCHTTIPRLTEYGYQFRKAGFRPPEEMSGEPTKNEFGDTFTARIQGRYDYQHRDDAGKTTTNNQITLHEITLYPLSSAFGKHYSSLMELSILNEDFVEIENAYFRYSRGKQESFFSGRVGIFHPFEGYGASDRPYSIDRPFIQTVVANQNGSTFFTPWNFDQAGLEGAYVYKRTSVSATIFNGLYVTDDEGAYKAFPAAGGELQKQPGFTKRNSKDFQLFVNQILNADGSGASFYYYHGNSNLPKPGVKPEDFGPGTTFENGYDRLALYANYRFLPKLEAQGAYQFGKDAFFDPVAGNANATFKSKGWFGEVDVPASAHLTLGVRYDWFDPSDRKSHNTRTGLTFYTNVPFNDGLQAIVQYRHIDQQRLGLANVKDDNFQVRLIWIW